MSGKWRNAGRTFLAVILSLVMLMQLAQPVLAAAPTGLTGAAAITLTHDGLSSTDMQGQLSLLALAKQMSGAGQKTAQTVTLPLLAMQGTSSTGKPPASAAPQADGLIVRYKSGARTRMSAQSLAPMGVQAGPAGPHGLQVLRVSRGTNPAAVLFQLRQDPSVEYAEPNYRVQSLDEPVGNQVQAQGVPNDASYADQWGLAALQAADAWDQVAWSAKQDVTVAVLDTGVDSQHEDLTDRVVIGRNLITGAPDPADTLDDSASGHGTHVAGIIAAATNNGLGIAGVAGELQVRVMPVKVLDASGSGTMYDVAQGIMWAADNGARVINLSLGARLPDFPRSLADAVEYAQNHGVLVVAAAGNEGAYSIQGFYPACLPGVISVAAAGQDQVQAAFSNPGMVLAPGVDILSTLPGNRYGAMSGTSMAAPFASGTAGLLVSAYPQTTTAQLAHALQYGKSGNLLNAYQALSQLNAGTYTNISLEEPLYGAHVTGQAELLATVSNTDTVAKVVFRLDPAGTGTGTGILLGNVLGPAAGGALSSGAFHFIWDTAQVADGPHVLEADAYDATGNTLSYDSTYVVVANTTDSGLSLQVVKPDGAPGAGASVLVYHVTKQPDGTMQVMEGQPVWSGPADLQGDLIIPAHEALDGNDYLVIARGTEPNYLYRQVVRAPAHVVIGPDGAVPVTVTGLSTAGDPLGDAALLADLTDVTASGYMGVNTIHEVPLVQLNSAGTGEVWLSPGAYHLRLVSPAQAYYLQRQVTVGSSPLTVDFAPAPSDVATLQLSPDGAFTGTGIELRDENGKAFLGFDRLNGAAAVTVTPGRYSAMLDAIAPDPAYTDQAGNGREWAWHLFVPTFQAEAGGTATLHYGGGLHSVIKNAPFYSGAFQPGHTAYMTADFVDAYGNLTTWLGWQLVAPSALSASAAATERQVTLSVPPAGAPWDPQSGSQPPTDGGKAYAFNTSSGQFEARTESFTDATRSLLILDAGGSQVADASGSVFWRQSGLLAPDDVNVFWGVPSTLQPGTYSARLTIQAGVLAPAGSGGIVSGADSSFQVGTSQSAVDLTVTVKDLLGNSLQGAMVMVLQRAAGGYYPAGGYGPLTTDAQGVARYGWSLDPNGTYAVAVWGESAVPDGSGAMESMFLMAPLEAGTPPLAVTVDPTTQSMTRLVLQGLDETGQLLDSYSLTLSAFGFDGEGKAAGMRLPAQADIDGFALWVPAGNYAFQVDYNPWSSMAEAWDSYYHLSQQVRVPADVPSGGMIQMGGSDLVPVTIQDTSDISTPNDAYRLDAYALFADGVTAATVFSGGAGNTLYVTPGTYRVESVLARAHYDGEWDYWLEGNITASAGTPVTVDVGGGLTAALTLDASEYRVGQTVHSTHSVTDAHGNRLIAVGEDLQLNMAATGTTTGASVPPLVWRLPDSSLAVESDTAGAAAAGSITQVHALNHLEIAPFLVIRDPAGSEVLRYKSAGLDWSLLGTWTEGQTGVPDGESTFFTGLYTVPDAATPGMYTAALELGASPDGVISDQATFTVRAEGSAPSLDGLPPVTNAATVRITGTAPPGALVTVLCRLDAGTAVEAGTTTAAADGRFALDVALAREGTYVFSAMASLDGVTSAESAGVSLQVDRTAPGAPQNLTGEGEDQNHISLTWAPPTDQDVAVYRVLRDGVQVAEVPVGSALTYMDGGLEPQTEYQYSVAAVDLAGNASAPATATVSTTLVPDQEAPTAPTGLVALYQSGGRAALSWKAATDNIQVVGYHIWRAREGEAPTLLSEVKATDALAYQDSGLPAETNYVYTVTALDEAGNESVPSDGATLSTPALTLSTPTWRTTPLLSRNQLIYPGSRIAVRMSGETGRQGSAEVEYATWLDESGVRLAQPRTVTEAVPMAEGGAGPGVYAGEFTLPQGAARLLAIRGTLQDGAGHTTGPREALGLPRDVTGSMTVSLNVPQGASTGNLTVVVWSQSALSGGGAAVPDGATQAVVTGLAPANDYTVAVYHTNGRRLGEAGSFVVPAGTETAQQVDVNVPASVRFGVVDPSGAPVAGVIVSVQNLTTQQPVDAVVTDETGWTPAISGDLVQGDSIRSIVVLQGQSATLPYRNHETLDSQLTAGDNSVQVGLQALPSGTLHGRTTDKAGTPLADIVVSATVETGGRWVTSSAVSDADGWYTLDVPTGTAQVDAATRTKKYLLGTKRTIAVPQGATTSLDLTLDTYGPGTVTVTLNTRYVDGTWTSRTNLGWSDLAHFRYTLWMADGTQVSTLPYPTHVFGSPGEVLIAKVDGQEVGLPQQTQQVTLDEFRNANVVFNLEEQCRIAGHLADAAGNPLPADHTWTATVTQLDDHGTAVASWGTAGANTGDVRIPLPEPGRYRIKFTTPQDWERWVEQAQAGYYAPVRSASYGDVVVGQGEIVDLGAIRLTTDEGLFAGNVSSPQADTTPGATITLRAEFGLSPLQTPATATNTNVVLAIPDGAELVAGSVTVNGTPVDVTPAATVSLPLGDLALSVGQKWVVGYRLRLADDFPGDSVQAPAYVEWGSEGQRSRNALVPATLQMVRVSLNAPAHMAEPKTTLWGRAPAGYAVTVYDGAVPLGQAQASPAGLWYLPVALPDIGIGVPHPLTARVEHATGSLVSPVVTVLYDPNQVSLVGFTMGQPGGRSITVDPSQGTPFFPFVVVPGKPFMFSARFTNVSRVSNVHVIVGSYDLPATKQADGTFSATTPPIQYNANIGNVDVKFEVAPALNELTVPTEEELRAQLPPEMEDFQVVGSGTLPDDPTTPNAHTSYIDIVPNQHSGLTARVELTIAKDVPYTPTDDETARAEATGVPVYAFDSTTSITPYTTTVTSGGYVPESALSSVSAAAQRSGDLHAAGLEVVLKIGTKVTISSGDAFNAFDWTTTLADGFGVPAKFRELEALLDQSSGCGSSAGGYRNELDEIGNQVMAAEASKYLISIAGCLLGPETFGLGTLALWAVSQGVGAAMDSLIDDRIADLKDRMAQDPECDDRTQSRMSFTDNPWSRFQQQHAASPTYTWDPSGFVYEAMPDSRLEGVTATVFQWDPQSQAWVAWDATWFGQQNPLVTDAQGVYAWDVPSGQWQVLYEKPGYETARSDVMAVPPPRTEVNIGLQSLETPAVSSVTAAPEGAYIQVTFNRYMRTDTLSASTLLVGSAGAALDQTAAGTIAGTVEPVSPVTAPDGKLLARSFRFQPDAAMSLAVGQEYAVTVSGVVQSYTGLPMGQDSVSAVTIPGAVVTPGEVSSLRVSAASGSLTARWADPASAGLFGVRVYWRESGTAAWSGPAEVAVGQQTYTITGLRNGTVYDVRVSTVDAVGGESPGITVSAQPGTPQGGGFGAEPRPASEEFRYTVSQSSGTLTAFDGQVTLSLPAGAFPSGTTLTVRRLGPVDAAGLVGAGQNSLSAGSPLYELDAEGLEPAQPVTLTVRYDQSLLAGDDLRRLGVYRQADSAPFGWTYVGGVIDPATGSITTKLQHFSHYAVLMDHHGFADLTGHWSRSDVEVLAARHIVGGVSPTEFQPERTITRAELVKLLVEMIRRSRPDLQVAGGSTPTFSDVAPAAWYYPYVETAARLGLLRGDAGRARPDAPVTREEMATMLLRAMAMEGGAAQAASDQLPYTDGDEVAVWARGYVALARQLGLMQGVTENVFQPHSFATRAQSAVVVLRAMEQQGLVLAPLTLTGTVRLVQLGGEHLELEVGAAGLAAHYVLLPAGGPTGDLATKLKALEGKTVQVSAVRELGANVYMTGTALKVFSATAAP